MQSKGFRGGAREFAGFSSGVPIVGACCRIGAGGSHAGSWSVRARAGAPSSNGTSSAPGCSSAGQSKGLSSSGQPLVLSRVQADNLKARMILGLAGPFLIRCQKSEIVTHPLRGKRGKDGAPKSQCLRAGSKRQGFGGCVPTGASRNKQEQA